MQFLFYFLLILFSLIAISGLFLTGWGIRKTIKTYKAKEYDYDISIGAIICGFLVFYAFSLSAFFMI